MAVIKQLVYSHSSIPKCIPSHRHKQQQKRKQQTTDLIYNLCLMVVAVPPGQHYTRSWHRWRGSSVPGGTAGGGGTPPPCHPERETGGWSRPLGGDRGSTWRLCLRERHCPPQFW